VECLKCAITCYADRKVEVHSGAPERLRSAAVGSRRMFPLLSSDHKRVMSSERSGVLSGSSSAFPVQAPHLGNLADIRIESLAGDLALRRNNLIQKIDSLVCSIHHFGVVLAAQAHRDYALVVLITHKPRSPELVERFGMRSIIPRSPGHRARQAVPLFMGAQQHVFLDARVRHYEPKLQVRSHRDWREISCSMTAGAHLVKHGKISRLLDVRKSAAMHNRHPHVIDPLVLYQLLCIPQRVEGLAVSQRCRGVLANPIEAGP
jgi:hypothetical protein